jgi:hypothetical protein
MMNLICTYKNGNYNVQIYDDGTKIRENDLDNLTPDFAESCDVKLTDKCSQGCKFCYEGCTNEGKHSDIMSQPWINSLHPYTELALNGNDLDHPQLQEFLEFLKQRKVIPNITVNQTQFINNQEKLISWMNEKLVYGVGVSYLNPSIIPYVQGIENIVIHTINGILTPQDIKELSGKNLKVLVLGYKTRGRGVEYKDKYKEDIEKNMKFLYKFLPLIPPMFKVISFDNLALEQLKVQRILSEDEWKEFYMGDDGQYTFYIDAVRGTFSKDSVTAEKERFDIGDKTIDEMFNEIRTRYAKIPV